MKRIGWILLAALLSCCQPCKAQLKDETGGGVMVMVRQHRDSFKTDGKVLTVRSIDLGCWMNITMGNDFITQLAPLHDPKMIFVEVKNYSGSIVVPPLNATLPLSFFPYPYRVDMGCPDGANIEYTLTRP